MSLFEAVTWTYMVPPEDGWRMRAAADIVVGAHVELIFPASAEEMDRLLRENVATAQAIDQESTHDLEPRDIEDAVAMLRTSLVDSDDVVAFMRIHLAAGSRGKAQAAQLKEVAEQWPKIPHLLS